MTIAFLIHKNSGHPVPQIFQMNTPEDAQYVDIMVINLLTQWKPISVRNCYRSISNINAHTHTRAG